MKMGLNNFKTVVSFIILACISISFIIEGCGHGGMENGENKDSSQTFKSKNLKALLGADEWVAPDTSTIPKDPSGDLIRYGRELVSNTGYYLGPGGKVNHFANGMNCQNCHLDAGTKLYANSYSAVHSIYPKFRVRSGTVENLEKRVNDCMERSLNGKKLDRLSREMRTCVAYINWVGKDVKKDSSPKGASVIDLAYLDRAADPEKGKMVFQHYCTRCHGTDGQGKLNVDSPTYLYPPLWGPHSYNTAAGLYRLSRFAGYVKSNMPRDSSSYYKPTLSDDEAWDVAAYINSMPRPGKTFKEDWPDVSKKPVDHPFGPYADNFSETQHKYGPYKEIVKAAKKK